MGWAGTIFTGRTAQIVPECEGGARLWDPCNSRADRLGPALTRFSLLRLN